MNDEVTLAQLAAAVAELRQQVEQVNQRLDMIYGAVTRLAETKPPTPPGDAGQAKDRSPAPSPAAATGLPLSAEMMMDPGAMLTSLHQYALNRGLQVSPETADRLKTGLAAAEVNDESS